MGHLLTDSDAQQLVAVSGVGLVEAVVHLLLRIEGLDDAQAAERLLHLTHRVAPKLLGLYALRLQLTADKAHEPAEDGYEDDGEDGELPRDDEQRDEVEEDENGVLKQHVERRHDAVLNLLYVAAHAGNDVALALLAEKAQRQRGYLMVELVADVAHNAGADGHDRGRRKEVGRGLEQRHEGEEEADEEQRRRGAGLDDHLLHIVGAVVGEHLLDVIPVPLHELVGPQSAVDLEEDLQDGDECGEGKDVEQCREDVEKHRHEKIFLIRRHEAQQHLHKLFHSLL